MKFLSLLFFILFFLICDSKTTRFKKLPCMDLDIIDDAGYTTKDLDNLEGVIVKCCATSNVTRDLLGCMKKAWDKQFNTYHNLVAAFNHITFTNVICYSTFMVQFDVDERTFLMFKPGCNCPPDSSAIRSGVEYDTIYEF